MVSLYGYPCYLVGSVLLSDGLLGCSRVIQNSSSVDELSPISPTDRALDFLPVCVQRACTVNDQHFSSYAIFHPKGKSTIKLSKSNAQDHSLITLCSTVITLAGFVCQFIGLRAMHWSVALMQLAATLIVTCTRAFSRRGLANRPICEPLPTGDEAAGLAYILGGAKAWEIPTGRYNGMLQNFGSSTPEPGQTELDSNASSDLINLTRGIRETMAVTDACTSLARQVTAALHVVMTIISRHQVRGTPVSHQHYWVLHPMLQSLSKETQNSSTATILCSSSVTRQIERSESMSEVSSVVADPETIAAILSLWLVVLRTRGSSNLVRGQHRPRDVTLQRKYSRILGNVHAPQGRYLRRWIAPETPLQISALPVVRVDTDPVFGMSFSSDYLMIEHLPL